MTFAEETRRALRLRADNLGLDFQQALQYYAMERFLFRLAQSRWADRLIVRGAALLRVWEGAVARPTRDIDFTGRINTTPEAVRDLVAECLALDAADGLVFSNAIAVQPIAFDDRYPGVRAKISGDLAGARFVLRLDIGIDDALVPDPGWVDYPTLLGGPAPRILAYAPETAVAEKFEAMVSLGLVNSRVKDFYDVWMLASTQPLDGQQLADALRATFGKRGTPLPANPPVALSEEFARQAQTTRMWHVFRSRLLVSGIETPEDLNDAIGTITDLVMPAAVAAAEEQGFMKSWTPGEGWK
ncbi:MAG: nucleotidyl transferase AbiEii/AbiGii toxin family protein [Actinobacteria bacterium]|nr:nucleotidyl transferase AbiEii/AbiGii toxin family protein [Actinomycetota bacterium]